MMITQSVLLLKNQEDITTPDQTNTHVHTHTPLQTHTLITTPSSTPQVINEQNHIINGKKVDPKKAKARHGKIFVGGLKPDLSDDDIKNYFGKFGTIVEVELPFDKQKNQRKGFCFITFEQEAVVTDLLKTPKQSIKGHEVDVKKATPKPDAMGMVRGGMRGAIRGTRGAAVRGGRGRGWSSTWNQGGYGGYGQGGYGGYYALPICILVLGLVSGA